MDLSTFYALVAGTCFTLVGLWWNVVDKHPFWHKDREARRLAGGVYLAFLLPGLMSLLAQVNPERPIFWRGAFTVASCCGIWSTVGLLGRQSPRKAGFLAKNGWIAAVVYGLVLVLALVPKAATLLGLAPLEAAALLLVALIVLAHALTWEFMLDRAPDARQ